MSYIKLIEVAKEPKDRFCVVTQQQGNKILGQTTLGVQVVVDQEDNNLEKLEMLVESILRNTKMLCTLMKLKQDVGGKAKLSPTIVVEVSSKGGHQDMACGI